VDLRPYQLEAIEAVRQEIRQGARKVLLIAPTGSGKTVMFCDVIQRAAAKGSRCVVIAHRRELVAQASQKLNAFGVQHGIVQAGFPTAPHRPVQVASIQTLRARPGILQRVDIAVVDEAHHIVGSTYQDALARWPGALVLGVTATPWRLDGKGLGDVFPAHVVARTPRQLRDEGFLVQVGGWEYEGIDTEGARVQRGDFVAGDLRASAISRRVVGDVVSEWLTHAAGVRTVLFALDIEHSQVMTAAFRAAGVAAEHVDGEMPTAELDAVLRRLRNGETRVVCNCNVLTEGFDCPELECCILARPTLSTALYLQMVGRVLRPSPDKFAARIHDHAGCLAAHGHPYAERDYSPLLSANRKRGEKAKQTTIERRCPSCKSVLARYPCDSCGYAPDPKELQRQYEFEEARARKKIEADGRSSARMVKDPESDMDRARKWARRYEDDVAGHQRLAFFRKMVERHGLAKGARVYWWVSGKTERVPKAWLEGESAGKESAA